MRLTQKLTNEKSTLVQVLDRCHQATIHYLSQCWSISTVMMPLGFTRPHGVNARTVSDKEIGEFRDALWKSNYFVAGPYGESTFGWKKVFWICNNRYKMETVFEEQPFSTQITTVSTVCSTVCYGNIKVTIKTSITAPLSVESIADQWIPLTKGQ